MTKKGRGRGHQEGAPPVGGRSGGVGGRGGGGGEGVIEEKKRGHTKRVEQRKNGEVSLPVATGRTTQPIVSENAGGVRETLTSKATPAHLTSQSQPQHQQQQQQQLQQHQQQLQLQQQLQQHQQQSHQQLQQQQLHFHQQPNEEQRLRLHREFQEQQRQVQERDWSNKARGLLSAPSIPTAIAATQSKPTPPLMTWNVTNGERDSRAGVPVVDAGGVLPTAAIQTITSTAGLTPPYDPANQTVAGVSYAAPSPLIAHSSSSSSSEAKIVTGGSVTEADREGFLRTLHALKRTGAARGGRESTQVIAGSTGAGGSDIAAKAPPGYIQEKRGTEVFSRETEEGCPQMKGNGATIPVVGGVPPAGDIAAVQSETGGSVLTDPFRAEQQSVETMALQPPTTATPANTTTTGAAAAVQTQVVGVGSAPPPHPLPAPGAATVSTAKSAPVCVSKAPAPVHADASKIETMGLSDKDNGNSSKTAVRDSNTSRYGGVTGWSGKAAAEQPQKGEEERREGGAWGQQQQGRSRKAAGPSAAVTPGVFQQQQQPGQQQQQQPMGVTADAEAVARARDVLSLRCLQQHDKGVKKIICQASFVSIYDLSRETRRWDRARFQGGLHVAEVDACSSGSDTDVEAAENKKGSSSSNSSGSSSISMSTAEATTTLTSGSITSSGSSSGSKKNDSGSSSGSSSKGNGTETKLLPGKSSSSSTISTEERRSSTKEEEKRKKENDKKTSGKKEKRSKKRKWRLYVLNQRSPNVLIEDINESFELEGEKNHIFYRVTNPQTGEERIRAIWVYDDEQRLAVQGALRDIIDTCTRRKQQQQQQKEARQQQKQHQKPQQPSGDIDAPPPAVGAPAASGHSLLPAPPALSTNVVATTSTAVSGAPSSSGYPGANFGSSVTSSSSPTHASNAAGVRLLALLRSAAPAAPVAGFANVTTPPISGVPEEQAQRQPEEHLQGRAATRVAEQAPMAVDNQQVRPLATTNGAANVSGSTSGHAIDSSAKEKRACESLLSLLKQRSSFAPSAAPLQTAGAAALLKTCTSNTSMRSDGETTAPQPSSSSSTAAPFSATDRPAAAATPSLLELLLRRSQPEGRAAMMAEKEAEAGEREDESYWQALQRQKQLQLEQQQKILQQRVTEQQQLRKQQQELLQQHLRKMQMLNQPPLSNTTAGVSTTQSSRSAAGVGDLITTGKTAVSDARGGPAVTPAAAFIGRVTADTSSSAEGAAGEAPPGLRAPASGAAEGGPLYMRERHWSNSSQQQQLHQTVGIDTGKGETRVPLRATSRQYQGEEVITVSRSMLQQALQQTVLSADLFPALWVNLRTMQQQQLQQQQRHGEELLHETRIGEQNKANWHQQQGVVVQRAQHQNCLSHHQQPTALQQQTLQHVGTEQRPLENDRWSGQEGGVVRQQLHELHRPNQQHQEARISRDTAGETTAADTAEWKKEQQIPQEAQSRHNDKQLQELLALAMACRKRDAAGS